MILGVDPGLAVTGWAIIVVESTIRYQQSAVIKTSTHMEHVERLRTIGQSLQQVVADTLPQKIGIERVFINNNPNTSLLLGEARGAAIMALTSTAIPVLELSALQIKQCVTGRGRASKRLVADMVSRLVADIPKALPPDCYDALACALSVQLLSTTRSAGVKSRHAGFGKRRLLRHLVQ